MDELPKQKALTERLSQGGVESQPQDLMISISDIVDVVDSGLFASTTAGRFLYANQSIARMSGYDTPEEFMKTRASDLYVDANDRERFLNELRTHGKVYRLETRSRRKDGSIYWVALSAVFVKKSEILVGTVHDITEHKRAELELKESEERYRLLVENSPEAVFVHRDGRLVFTNNAGVKLLGGKSAAEMKGMSMFDRVHPDDREMVRMRIEKSLKDGSPAPLVEERIVRFDGTVISIEVSGVPIPYEGSTALLSTVRDISARHLAEEHMQTAQRLESLGVLAGGIAHDFNNLLGGIYGHVDLAMHALNSVNIPTAQSHLLQIKDVFTRAMDLTQQLLTFAKGGAPARKPGNINRVVQEAASFALSGSNVRGLYDLCPNLNTCSFDLHQIAQVIDNIILNAIQSMPNGGVVRVSTDNVFIEKSLGFSIPEGRYVQISIEDEGTGISSDILPRIFDPFFSTRVGGTGLGLSTAWSILKRHGGTIEVRSEVGKGTKFCCYLPISEEAPLQSSMPPVQLQQGNGRILIMDDEDFIREIASTMLEAHGYETCVAEDGARAVFLYREALEQNKPFDVTIVDLTVPGGVGGLEALRRITEVDPKACVVASSGYASDPVMAEPKSFGFCASLAKPYEMSALISLMAKLVVNKDKD